MQSVLSLSLFLVWLLSLSKIILRFIHVVSVCFILLLNNISLFGDTISPVDGYLGGFHFLAMNK